MFSGNGVPAASDRDKGIGVRGDSQQLREVKDLISRLDDVNKKLALPARVMSAVLVDAVRADDAARNVDSVELPAAS
jgi:hypothetical protein